MTNFNNKEYLFHPVPDESVHQTVERNYYKYVAPQNQQPSAFEKSVIYNQEPSSSLDPIKKIGEFAADAKIAYDYLQKMKQTGRTLVNKFGPNQGADIDNYYHPLLQCELAQISPQSRANGIALGYAKEGWDYLIKRFGNGMAHNEIVQDSRKDLQNNLYGSNLGYNNPNRTCTDLLDDMRTENMKKLGIK